MTLVVLRPTSTVSNIGTLTGGATAHAVLADDSDASYVNFTTGQFAAVELADLTLPAGAIVKDIAMRARAAVTVNFPRPTTYVDSGGLHINGQVVPSSTVPTTYQFGSPVAGWTDADIDAAIMSVGVGGNNGANIYAMYLDVRLVVQPVVAVTAPTGTLTTTNTPTVVWTTTWDPEGWLLVSPTYEVKIFSAAQYGAGGFSPDTSTPTTSSGVRSGDGSWPITVALANATYRAYVRAAQTVNGATLWSAWDYEQFIINVTPPSAPSVALVAENGRVKITLDDVGGLSTDRFEVQRSVDGGTTWMGIRIHDTYDVAGAFGLITPPSTAAFSIYDYEAPEGTSVQYRARALHNYSGLYAASGWTTSSVTWASTNWWLKSPNRPALNVILTTRSFKAVQRAARQGVFPPLGASLPIVISDTRGGATGSITVLVTSLAMLQRLEALLDAAGVCLLQGPAIHGEPDRYVVIGAQETARIVDAGPFVRRDVTLAWTEVPKPDGVMTGAEWAP